MTLGEALACLHRIAAILPGLTDTEAEEVSTTLIALLAANSRLRCKHNGPRTPVLTGDKCDLCGAWVQERHKLEFPQLDVTMPPDAKCGQCGIAWAKHPTYDRLGTDHAFVVRDEP